MEISYLQAEIKLRQAELHAISEGGHRSDATEATSSNALDVSVPIVEFTYDENVKF